MEPPLIDVSPLRTAGADITATARAIDDACREVGFFRITGHGIAPERFAALDALSRACFALDDRLKEPIAMRRSGKAWRGWFPLGGELTSGVPDGKEGIYFGSEDAANDPRPLRGANLFLSALPGLRGVVLDWMASMRELGALVLGAMAVGLGLERDWFDTNLLLDDPVQLFRIFHYPQAWPHGEWGVAEHTDYGLLTLLAQDASGGLEVKVDGEWFDVPADPHVIVCNLGDMLDRMTAGRYRSTAHRVRVPPSDRLAFPYFLDPAWDARVTPIPLHGDPAPDDRATRWDATSLRDLDGTYGDYLLAKVSKVFPELAGATLGSNAHAVNPNISRATPTASTPHVL